MYPARLHARLEEREQETEIARFGAVCLGIEGAALNGMVFPGHRRRNRMVKIKI